VPHKHICTGAHYNQTTAYREKLKGDYGIIFQTRTKSSLSQVNVNMIKAANTIAENSIMWPLTKPEHSIFYS